MRCILGHKPSKKRYLVIQKEIGKTRMVEVGARKCVRCGQWLGDYDCRIINL